jgi:uncharacterized protein involved in exopolysaccharide biosynthesis
MAEGIAVRLPRSFSGMLNDGFENMYTQVPEIENELKSVAKRREPRGEIGFRQFIALIAKQKLAIAIIVATFTLAAIGGIMLVSKRFEATAVVSPATEQQGGDKTNSLTSQLGGIAALAGIGSSSGGRRFETIATLQSEALTERYIRDNNLLPILYAKRWDAKLQDWKPSTSRTPTYWMANRYFKSSIRRITEDPKTGLVNISITWKDPVLAAKWANDLVRLTNEYLRSKAIMESERRIAYLTEEASRASSIEVKSSIYSLLESEIKSQTLARGTDEYALKVIDPAFVPESPSFPIPLLWIALGVFSGLVAGFIFALVRADWISEEPERG